MDVKFQIHHELQAAMRLHQAGQIPQAEAAYRAILAREPENADAMHLIGILAMQRQDWRTAIGWIGRAAILKPKDPTVQNNLGESLRMIGRTEDAIACYERAIKIQPDWGRHTNLGIALTALNRLDDAVTHFRAALALHDKHTDIWLRLATALRRLGRVQESIDCCLRAQTIDPQSPGAFRGLGFAHLEAGRVADAIENFRQLLAQRPNASVYHTLLLALNYEHGNRPQEVAAEHRRWAERYAHPLYAEHRPHDNAPDPDRRLRIGYVSDDFRRQSVAFFLEPIFAHYDRARFEVTCYSGVIRPDDVTNRLKLMVDRWRDTADLDDAQLADMVRRDGIDLLIDLQGHAGKSRLLAFARKPAPVQINYLGYPNTTGLDAVDYRVTDPFADPPGLTDPWHAEKLLRMPESAWCYRPPEEAPDVAPLPATVNGHVTFGCFNILAKLTPETIALWSQVLNAVPNSRLLLKTRALADDGVQSRIRDDFARHGIDAGRIILHARSPSLEEHLSMYNRVDIGLDPFPYHGTTTTCESLWMGVPVVTRAGNAHVSRVGISLLSNVGLHALIAPSPEQYVEIASKLAHDRARMKTIREGLRERMRHSPLMDARTFTKDLESLYLAAWTAWCARQPTPAP